MPWANCMCILNVTASVFDDVILAEEGRTQFDAVDDYELFLGEQGYPGQMFGHGMCNNDYLNRPWHLPEHCHVTNWATQNMARMIQRRDPTKPGFWFLSYCHPHPPLAPLQCYLDMYRDLDPPMPYTGDWAKLADQLPFGLKETVTRMGRVYRIPNQIGSACLLRHVHPH